MFLLPVASRAIGGKLQRDVESKIGREQQRGGCTNRGWRGGEFGALVGSAAGTASGIVAEKQTPRDEKVVLWREKELYYTSGHEGVNTPSLQPRV